MSNERPSCPGDPLPKQVDVRRLIAAGASLTVTEPVARFARLREMVESDEGCVDIALRFFIDEQGVRRIDGEVRTTLQVLCQRCLQPMALPVDSAFGVAVVWSDEDAGRVPRYLDPYIVGDEPQDLRDLIEDELIISVPYVSYHEVAECSAAPTAAAADAPAERKANPFTVLERLKSGH